MAAGKLLASADMSFPPASKEAIRWSDDGKAAVITDQAVYVFVSRIFGRSSRRFQTI